ncbi:MAG: hypothetical protein GXP62_09795 [Oligoflexia bacterium]|nr:hypothetical protein [Oligoflexia bacterium]
MAPKRSHGVVMAVAAGMAALILLCAVGGYALVRLRNAAVDATSVDATADATAPPERTPTVDDALAAAAGDLGAEPADNTDSADKDATPLAAPADSTLDEPTAMASSAPATTTPTSQPARHGTFSPPPARASSTPPYSTPVYSTPAHSNPSRSSARSSSRSSASSHSSARSLARQTPVADLETPSEDTGRTVAIDLGRYASPANTGDLTSSDVMALETVEIDNPSYTRSRALLLMNAQRQGEESATKRYLDQLMLLPENQYNPIYLSDLGRYYVNRKQYQRALDTATLAERYWARLPPELVFSKKTEIYETQASAWQGRFYQSGDDLELLDEAIRHWEKYRDHVETKSRSDLARQADAQLAKLEDIKSRLN